MSTSAAQLRFAAEFATFLAAGAGVCLALLRPQLVVAGRGSRATMCGGFVAVGVAAFLHGSLVVADDRSIGLVALRGVGLIVLAVSAVRWNGNEGSRRIIWLGLGLLAVAMAVTAAAASADTRTTAQTAADMAGLVGALALGFALFSASRRSIPARVAASAAGTLLLVVLAVSLALSTVISSSVQRQAVDQNKAQADAVAKLIRGEQINAIKSATLLARSFPGNLTLRPQLLGLVDGPGDATGIQTSFNNLSATLFSTGPLVYVVANRNGTPGRIAARVGISGSDAIALGGSRLVAEAIASSSDSPRGSAQVVGNLALSVGVTPVVVPVKEGGTQLVGAVVATTLLDQHWLALNAPGERLAIISRGRVLSALNRPPTTLSVRVGRSTLTSAKSFSDSDNDFFASATPVILDDSTPEMAVVSTTPVGEVESARESLYQRLFVVALGAALLALLLASIVGERIGAGLRTLTEAAEGIQRGDLSVRAGVNSEDEVGLLGAAFDTMATSIESMTADLREAADDEARLRNRVEAIVAGMGEALVAVDADGKITAFNDAAEKLVGVTASRALGKSVRDVLRGEAADGSDLSARLSRPDPEPWSGPATVIRRDGTAVPVVVSAGALRGAVGELTGEVLVVRDMRREREVERMKTEFLSNISHELRTPLTPIKGYAEMLRSRPVPDDRKREFLDGILEATDRLERVIDRLVNYAALDAGRLTLRPEEIDVRDMIDRVVDRWSSRAPGHDVKRRVARTVRQVRADRRLIERSIDELVDNAVKYSPAGGRVDLRAEVSNNGHGPALEISVRDQGVGIPPDRAEAIFGEFIQADGSATREFGGLGLGLSFVRRIARAHDGDLVCDSTPGKGSTFSLVLPLHQEGNA